MKKSTKVFGLAFALFALVGCTQSFCTNSDKANMLASYAEKQEEKIIEEIEDSGVICPTDVYYNYLEDKVYEYAIIDESIKYETFGNKQLKEYTIDELKSVDGVNANGESIKFSKHPYYANIKYLGHSDQTNNISETLWYNYDLWTKDFINNVYKGNTEITIGNTTIGTITYTVTLDDVPSEAYVNAYKTAMNNSIATITACITPQEGIYDDVYFEEKNWGDAFNLGLIEGLIEYPIAWMLHSFYNVFNIGAWGAILSILIVTIIVRLLLLAISFKSTIAQTKMQEIQPQLNALQAKYPNSNTNEYEKRALAQAQADLYKKHGINPFSTLLIMFVQFPIFIAVWGAMSGTAILRVDTLFAGNSLFELNLNNNMNDVILAGNIGAIILFVLMSAAQILSAKLPTWIQKREQSKGPKMGKNPAQAESQKQMNMVSNIMMIMIIFMGFTLPVGMAIYWFISALISLAQTFIVRKIGKNKQQNKAGFAKYKTKK